MLGDTAGSMEAIQKDLLRLPRDRVQVHVLEASLGDLTMHDVQVAELTRGKMGCTRRPVRTRVHGAS